MMMPGSKLESKADIDTIYEALCKTCDVLEALSCDYFLSGGTLLGAFRSGDLIPHDIDFDLDCLIKDEETILKAVDLFSEKGLTINKKLSLAPRHFLTLERTQRPLYSSCIVVKHKGIHVGDISIYTIFDDGIARRFDPVDGVYSNPKMSIPSWYYSGNEILSIRGRKFRSMRSPELVLEKVYGADWRIPLKAGQFQKGRNKASGAVADANIEKTILYALNQGWTAEQAGAPTWPQPFNWIGWPAKDGREWILRHELMLRPELAACFSNISNLIDSSKRGQLQALLKVAMVKAIQSENERIGLLVQQLRREQGLLRRLYHALDLPVSWRLNFSKIYNLIFCWR